MRLASVGEIEMIKRFAALGNAKKKQIEDGVTRKKGREASLCRRKKEMMEIARDQRIRKNEDNVQGTEETKLKIDSYKHWEETGLCDWGLHTQKNRKASHQTRSVNRRPCCLSGARIRDVDMQLKRSPDGSGLKFTDSATSG
ncbi:unnamed protein product [Lepidochelys kempii]